MHNSDEWSGNMAVGEYRNQVFYNGLGDAVRTVAMDALSRSKTAKYGLWQWVGEKRGREIVKANVSLIRTIDEDRLPKIVSLVVKALKGEITRDKLVSEIERVGEVEGDRAEIIANDQIAKATTMFKMAKWKAVGWKRVQWKHSPRIPEPREYHRRKWDGKSGVKDGHPNGLNGFVFEMSNPPVIDEKTGERGYPAQLINCHCFLVPYD